MHVITSRLARRAAAMVLLIVGGAVVAMLPMMAGVARGQSVDYSFGGETWQSSPGAAIHHRVVLVNRGGEDTISLRVVGDEWPAELPPSVSVARTGNYVIPVTVTVPFTAGIGDFDGLVLTGTSSRTGGSASVSRVSSTGGVFDGAGYVGCRHDLDSSGAVDEDDVGLLVSRYNDTASDAGYEPNLDLDHSGRIGAADVQAVAGRVGEACPAMPTADSTALREAVTIEGVRRHLDQLEAIADANDGNRAATTPGYDASVQYIEGQLSPAGYEVQAEAFEIDMWEELEPSVLQRVSPDPRVYTATEFALLTYSGSGDVTAQVQPIDLVLPPGPNSNSSTSGCEDSDFADFVPGRIALVQRGTCSYYDKALRAKNAGASGMLLFNEGQAGRTGVVRGSLWVERFAGMPAIGTSYEVGQELAAYIDSGQQVTVRMFARAGIVQHPSSNVLAELPGGDPNRVVLLGAHLDSVPVGPGINDNGSGCAVILEIALQMAQLEIAPRNKVRLAFWGAEERGLLGSTHHVSQLEAGETDDIMLNLNFDMVGSPNFVRYVYDGDYAGAHPAAREIQGVFGRYLDSEGLLWESISLGGASDHAAFSAIGIPVGGLFTGAGSEKTASQAARYGGTEGAPLDPCYHRACDRTDNVSYEVLAEFADAAAHAAYVYAMDERDAMRRPPAGTATGLLLEFQQRGPVGLR